MAHSLTASLQCECLSLSVVKMAALRLLFLYRCLSGFFLLSCFSTCGLIYATSFPSHTHTHTHTYTHTHTKPHTQYVFCCFHPTPTYTSPHEHTHKIREIGRAHL